MSTVSIRKLKNPAMRAFKRVCAITAGITLAISVFAMADDDGYLFLLGKNTKIGAMIMRTVHTITTAISGSSTTTDKVVGTDGVDYLLVAKMNEGYAKDYLSIALENQNGKLDTKKRKFFASPETIVAINVAESSCYSVNGGGTLPKSDIPESKIKSEYGKNGVSLYTWDKTNHASGGASGTGGPFAFTPGNGSSSYGFTDIGTESVYNTKHTTTKKLGDAYLFPDAVCGLNNFVGSAMGELGISPDALKKSEYHELIMAAPTAANHNSGSGFIKQLYGKQAFSHGTPKSTEKETMERLEILINDFKKAADSLSESQISSLLEGYSSPNGEYYGYVILVSQGWKIPQSVLNRAVSQYSYTSKMWNCLFPNDKVNSSTQLRNKMQKYVYTVDGIAKELGMSAEAFKKVYLDGCATYAESVLKSGSGFVTQSQTAGTVKVIGGKTKAWGKETSRLMHMGGIQLKPVTTALLFSERIIKRMMIYGGVDKHLVNGTGMKKMGGNGGTTDTGNFTMENKYWNKLKANGCDKSKLTEHRYKVLRSGLKIMEHTTRYSQSASLGRCGTPKCTKLNHPVYDCSSFCGHSVNAAGFELGMPMGTGLYSSSRSVNKVGAASSTELLPGDLLCTYGKGHVLLFVGRKGGKIHSMEAKGINYGIGFFTVGNLGRYLVYRPKDFY